MPCGSGCCKPSVPPDTSVVLPSETVVVGSSSTDDQLDPEQDTHGCCGNPPNSNRGKSISKCGAVEAPIINDDCALKQDKADCNEGCCGGPGESDTPKSCPIGEKAVAKDPSSVDNCSGSKSTKPGCKKACCSAPELYPRGSSDFQRPVCCEGKDSPCCNTDCLDRLALRECEGGKKHAGLKRPGSRDSIGSCSNNTRDFCEGSKSGKACGYHSRKTRTTYATTLDALGCICRALLALGKESCCLRPERPSADSCCATATSSGLKAADPCCVDEIVQKPKETLTENNSVPVDPEKGLSGQEHVILSISGMTCTGCETKLKRTLGTVHSVKNLKTSLVLARAEFDLDLRLGSLSEVMKHLEKTTEFKCEKLSTQGSTIDLVAPLGSHEFMNRPWPDGVTEIRQVDKSIVSVAFDPKIIGARDLVEKGWDLPLELAPLRGDLTLEAGSRHVRHVGLMTLLSIILTIPVLVMAWAPLPKREVAYSSASLCLATIVQLAIAGPFYPKALKSLIFSRMVEMDLLIVLSTSAAYVFSVVSFGYLVAGRPLSTDQFFETSTLLVTLIMVGRYVGALARQKAVESISVRSLQESTAVLVGESEDVIDIRLLQYGDIFKAAPDARIPTDGTVISGSSDVDESMITGESSPVPKYVRSSVIAGSINGSGMLHVRLTRLAGDNTVSTIADMVDEAKLSKPKIQDIADRVASYFVPVVVTLTIITFVIWVAIGVGVRNQTGAEATVQAITYAITVLIVSCPCAIGLAVPMVIVIASGVAAERGVVFKSADSIEVAYKTSHVVFDKTGTLTEGKLSINQEIYTDNDSSSARSLLLGLVTGIKHPVSMAVATHLKEQAVVSSVIADQKALTGKGVEGTSSGLILRAGNSHWLDLASDHRVQAVLSQGYTAFCFTINDTLAAIFALEDPLRPESTSTVTTLLERGISVHIVSGDDEGAVRSIAKALQIPSTNVRSRSTPADKRAYIEDLLSSAPTNRNQKTTRPVVIFCGDGTNDAVALSAATIGIHMNEGTEVAKSAADVVLMRSSIEGILTVMAVSRKSIHRVWFNFGWSFVYNLFAILLGAGAFVNARIPPEFAGLGELVSVVPVVIAAVALRLERV
ncbi:copper-translocating P-type ATPase [Aspergillus steynii IBT 23096]|uniref:Copper-translocating P-type ATPase n=1 Tax=Aspergillus steynii IBT 23096 TaxID=1392250 RepID=A0A2I2G461_9EURO|nr:copper-translocating P-type ATPase [Aspergillus steynii IBT 23096]PLB47665.1 copper-translocating P-type ATPase [Aspergillus steynii IBT 23096]